MATTSTFTCICGVQKKVSNHWILAIPKRPGMEFMPWDWHLALSDDVIVLCGEGCATALLSRSLSEWNHASSANTVAEHALAEA